MESTERTSILVNRWLADQQGETCSLADLFTLLERRSFGGVIILLSIIGLLPGISIAAGMAIIFIGLQMLLEFPTPRLPAFITRRHVNLDRLRRSMSLPLRYLQKVESVIRPSWSFLTSRWMRMLTAIIIILLAVVMITPLPLSNVLPAIALLLIALGLLENDGRVLLAGYAASAFALVIGTAIIGILYRLLVSFYAG